GVAGAKLPRLHAVAEYLGHVGLVVRMLLGVESPSSKDYRQGDYGNYSQLSQFHVLNLLIKCVKCQTSFRDSALSIESTGLPGRAERPAHQLRFLFLAAGFSQRNTQAGCPKRLHLRPTRGTAIHQFALNHDCGNTSDAETSSTFRHSGLPHVEDGHVTGRARSLPDEFNGLHTAGAARAEDSYMPLLCHVGSPLWLSRP